jgi:type I restriction enzyme R subunit
MALPIRIENRKIEGVADYSSYGSEGTEVGDILASLRSSRVTMEHIHKLAEDIVQHFEARQQMWTGKGIIVVSDIRTGVTLSHMIAKIWGDAALAKTISSMVSHEERQMLTDRFQKHEDSLVLLIATGSFLTGLDNPLIHTIYITYPVSLQLRYQLAGLVSRPYKGKEDALIVDYTELNWGLEDLL